MTPWMPRAGATLLIRSGQGNHLFVALNDPRPFDGYGSALCLALVNFSSVPKPPAPFDNTCVLAAGCHPFVQHDSYVYYRHTRIEQERDVLQRLAQGVYIPHEPVTAAVLARIRAGLLQSPFTRREFKLLGI